MPSPHQFLLKSSLPKIQPQKGIYTLQRLHQKTCDINQHYFIGIPLGVRGPAQSMKLEHTAKRYKMGRQKTKPRAQVKGHRDKVLQDLVLSQVAMLLLRF